MSAGWVAVGVRARGITRRCLSPELVREVAASSTLESAIDALGSTQYGQELRVDQRLEQAQRSVTATLLWNTRVLAGWAPRRGVTMLRALLGAYEISNVIGHLQRLAGMEAPAAHQLGALATAWPRLERTESREQLRHVLAASPWGDPGGDQPEDIGVAMRASLYDRMIAAVPVATGWAGAATLLLVARQHFLAGRDLPAPARLSASRVVGAAAVSASTLAEMAAAAPSSARWVLAGITDPSDLWTAEARWWGRLVRDGWALHRRPVLAAETMVGTVAVTAGDAWRVRAALELADQGGGPLEILHAVV